MTTTVRIIAVGKIRERFISDGISEYEKRLKSFVNLEFREVSDERIPDNPSSASVVKILLKEGRKLLGHVKESDYAVLLDLKGEMPDSYQLAKKIKDLEISGKSSIVFLIGGSLGVSDELIARADYRLCLSGLTFTHQMARLILTEQIYRAYSINSGGKYHR